MTLLPMETPKPFAHRLASLQSRAWLPPTLLLLALASVFLFGYDQRGYFYRSISHNIMSAKNLAIAENLSPEHHFLMFREQTLDADGRHTYKAYNRFPVGGYALIKLAILPFGDDLSAKIYAARMLMLLFFAGAAVLAYLASLRLTASRWIALTVVLLAFSSTYCLYYSDIISNEAIIDLFAVMLVFHGMAVFEQEERFRQLMIKTCAALLLGWHVYALLLPFIAFGLIREIIKSQSGVSAHHRALRRIKHTALSLLSSRYLTLGVVALLFGVSMLTINFTNEYFALKRETSLTELPSFRSMLNRTGVYPYNSEYHAKFMRWPGFLERQFYRIGTMSLPYAFSPPYVLERMMTYNFVDHTGSPQRLFAILGIAVSGASLIGLLFVHRHKILFASLVLSGFCWALPARYNTAPPNHNFEAIFYIGVALIIFSLILLLLRRFSREWFIAALSVAALLIFLVSTLRIAQPDNSNQMAELHKAAIADFDAIRNATQGGDTVFIQKNYVHISDMRFRILELEHYLAKRIIMYGNQTAPFVRPPDFVVASESADRLASLTPRNQMLFLYKWDDYRKYIWHAYHRRIDQMIEQARAPIIRSSFDVYLDDNTLIYVKDACSARDADDAFFLALYPAHESDLPAERRQHGFDNLDFYLPYQGNQQDGRCIAIAPLPEYDIARIYTGQFIQRADGSFQHLWESEFRLPEAAY